MKLRRYYLSRCQINKYMSRLVSQFYIYIRPVRLYIALLPLSSAVIENIMTVVLAPSYKPSVEI
jgi:hypothetical protein